MKRLDLEEVLFPEGFAEKLRAVPVEQQTAFFRTGMNTVFSNTGWGERRQNGHCHQLDEDDSVTAIVVHDGIIVGVMLRNAWGGETYCRPEGSVCTYYASDNNGAGYQEREDYTKLLCVSEDFEEAFERKE